MESALKGLAEYGVGIFAIAVIGFILYYFIKEHRDEMKSAREERQASQKVFMNYIETNNHQKTELIKEHTATNIQVKNSIEQNTKLVERLVDKLN